VGVAAVVDASGERPRRVRLHTWKQGIF